jgi:hypothetical protein
MLIEAPVRHLGHVDCQALTERVLAADEASWHEDTRRQDDYEVHAESQSIILSFCTGWPKVRVNYAKGWDTFADAAVPVMHTLIEKHYAPGGLVLRAMLARLRPGCRIARHRDAHPSFAVAHRIHIPLVTNPDVFFIVGNERVEPRTHFAFELNNAMSHEVTNTGQAVRIHFIFDYAPTSG